MDQGSTIGAAGGDVISSRSRNRSGSSSSIIVYRVVEGVVTGQTTRD